MIKDAPFRTLRFGDDNTLPIRRVGFVICNKDGLELATTIPTYIYADGTDASDVKDGSEMTLAQLSEIAAVLAASAELLDALKMILPLAIEQRKSKGFDPDTDPGIMAARAAIAKATPAELSRKRKRGKSVPNKEVVNVNR